MKYDVIIVGAGSAGTALATRLSEDPQRSVLYCARANTNVVTMMIGERMADFMRQGG